MLGTRGELELVIRLPATVATLSESHTGTKPGGEKRERMSPRREPGSLLSLCQQSVERSLLWPTVRSSWVESVGLALPYNTADKVLASVLTNLTSAQARARVGGLFSPKIKKLRLDQPRDLSEEKDSAPSYICRLVNCPNLQSLYLGEKINKNSTEEVSQILKKISTFPNLQSLTLKSCSAVLSKPVETEELLEELQRLPLLQQLDISGASFDDSSFQSLLKLKTLRSLCLDNCKLGVLETLQVLTGLHQLVVLEHNYGRQSRVVQALSTLPDSTKLKLTQLTLRQPPRPTFFNLQLSKIIPNLRTLTVIWDIFEIGYSTAIDQGLAMLGSLETVKSVVLKITGINMLYMIQLAPKIEAVSERITR